MRVGLGQRFFTGKQIAPVRLVIYSTNWVERLNHCYSYLVLAWSDALPASVVYFLKGGKEEKKDVSKKDFCLLINGV